MTPTSFELFLFMLKYALTSFGGLVTVLPAMESELAARTWLSHADFANTYALVQVLPGPNSIFCLLLGYKIAGGVGFAAASLGVFLPPVLLMTVVWQILKRQRDHSLMKRLGAGLKFVILALMLTATRNYLMLQTLHAPGTQNLHLASLGLAGLSCATGLTTRLNKTAIIVAGAVLWAAFAA